MVHLEMPAPDALGTREGEVEEEQEEAQSPGAQSQRQRNPAQQIVLWGPSAAANMRSQPYRTRCAPQQARLACWTMESQADQGQKSSRYLRKVCTYL